VKNDSDSSIPGGIDRGGADPPKQPKHRRTSTHFSATQDWLQHPGGPGSDGRDSDYNQDLLNLYSTGQEYQTIDAEKRAYWAQLSLGEMSQFKRALDKKINCASIFGFVGILAMAMSIYMLHRIYGSMMGVIAETYPDDGPMPADVRAHKSP